MSDPNNPNTPGNVALWSAANANLFQNNLAAAAVAAAKNSDGTPVFPNFTNTPIPFGSTINVTNPVPTAAGGKLAQAALATLAAMGIGSWGLGLLKPVVPVSVRPPVATSSEAAQPTVPPAPVSPPASPVTIEGILNWELTPDGQLSTSIESAAAGS
jgi:hypothetical protein